MDKVRALIGVRDKQSLWRRLTDAGVRMNPYAEALLDLPSMYSGLTGVEVQVRAVTLLNLGLERGGTYDQVLVQGRSHGLSPVPLALVPALRLAWLGLPEGPAKQLSHAAPPGSVTVATEPVSLEPGFQMGFYLLTLNGQAWLRGYRCTPDHVWSAEDRFAFAVAA